MITIPELKKRIEELLIKDKKEGLSRAERREIRIRKEWLEYLEELEKVIDELTFYQYGIKNNWLEENDIKKEIKEKMRINNKQYIKDEKNIEKIIDEWANNQQEDDKIYGLRTFYPRDLIDLKAKLGLGENDGN